MLYSGLNLVKQKDVTVGQALANSDRNIFRTYLRNYLCGTLSAQRYFSVHGQEVQSQLRILLPRLLLIVWPHNTCAVQVRRREIQRAADGCCTGSSYN